MINKSSQGSIKLSPFLILKGYFKNVIFNVANRYSSYRMETNNK